MVGKFSFIKTIDYYDAVIMIIASVMIMVSQVMQLEAIELEAMQLSSLKEIFATAPFLFLSFILLILDLRNYDTKWMAYSSVLITGTLIGFTHFNLLLMLTLLFCSVIRIAKSPPSEYLPMFVTVLVAMVFGFLSSSFIGVFDVEWFDVSSIETAPSLLLILLSVGIIFIEFVNIFDKVNANEDKFEAYQTRIRDLAHINNNLARFVPDQIWQPLIRDNTPANLFNKRAKLTIFFSDIVGFTHLSDNLSADVLTDILNTYMDRMTIVAQRHDAVLDKFIGDGMMCFFGAHGSRSVKENSLACIEMAIDMRREMRDLRRKWQADGFEGLYIRMGVNTGFCHVGNFGTDLRMSYTIIGKEVNLASRLESIAEPDEIVISQSTYDYIGYDYNCEIMGETNLKGFDDAVICWRVKDPITSELKAAQWVNHDLPGFNLHLNFKDMKNYDYSTIRQYLGKAIERVDSAEIISSLSSEKQKF